MRSDCMAKELSPVLCGDLDGEEIEKRRDACICTAESLSVQQKLNTTL